MTWSGGWHAPIIHASTSSPKVREAVQKLLISASIGTAPGQVDG